MSKNTFNKLYINWDDDLNIVSEELPKYHINLFHYITSKNFYSSIKKIKNSLGRLSNFEIIISLLKIISSIGDSHTRILWQNSPFFNFIPIKFFWFKEGIYTIEAADDYKTSIKSRLNKIGNISIENVVKIIKNIIPYENNMQLKEMISDYLTSPEILLETKMISDYSNAEFEFVNDKNINHSLTMSILKCKNNYINTDSYIIHKFLNLSNKNKNYWFDYLKKYKTIYFQYNNCYDDPEVPFINFCTKMFNFIKNTKINKFILDIRNNSGGKSKLAKPFIKLIKENSRLNQYGVFFIIIGRKTYSSAILNAMQLKNECKTIFVGEPTSGKPNHYGEVNSIILPNSKLELTFSTKYFSTSTKDLPSIIPDIPIELTAQNYFSGFDAFTDKILKL